MSIEIAPETERKIREEIDRGHFRSVDEIIAIGVQAWYEKNPHTPIEPATRKSLAEVFAMIRGLADDLDLTRNPSPGRPVDLG